MSAAKNQKPDNQGSENQSAGQQPGNGRGDLGSDDPAVDALVKPSPGYPDVLVKTDGEHPARDDAYMPPFAQRGDRLTTTWGTPVDGTDDSVKVGRRGPTMLDDFHLRDKIMHFDHERIPERVVHARGVGAHGHFRPYRSLADLTCAEFLSDPDMVTPVFVRFSTVLGSRGAPDTAREVRGFATKFYTSAGNFDLVGNNIPVFFIQDGIKFPDLIHAAKPEPHREIPQAATAHDTFWDFVSLLPESTHMLLWSMSDRALPRSFRMMEGFGVHTFRLVNAAGESRLAKFHWKPLLGTHSLVWEESQKLAGVDPDYLRRDLYDAIDAGVFPEWELGLQLFPDTEDQMFEGIDLLDATKLVPEELAPVERVGRLVLDRNVNDYFAETEQVAFCTAHLVTGIEATDDPLLQARNFSYLDTQITRLGGPNFESLPINRPRSAVNSMTQDGFGQSAILGGRVRYSPNSLGGGCPFPAGLADGGFERVPRTVSGEVIRGRAEPSPDYFSQATLFWRSMTPIEQDHIVGAFSFELGKVEVAHVRERMVRNLAEVDTELCRRVAAALGMPAPIAPAPSNGGDGAGAQPAGEAAADLDASPALSQVIDQPGPVDGRLIAVLAADGVDAAGVAILAAGATAAGARVQVVGTHLGLLQGESGAPLPAPKAFLTAQSVEFDAVVVAGGVGADELVAEPYAAMFVEEAFRHHKTVAAWGEGRATLARFGVDAGDDAPGVVLGGDEVDEDLVTRLLDAVGRHRHWDRASLPTAMARR
ncbi:MAG: catalase [Acidimicrobiales bacterium]